MTPLIIYFIKVNVALALLYAFYKLLFAKDTFFGLRRFMLILIYATSFIYPLLDFSGWIISNDGIGGQTVANFYSKVLPEITIFAHSTDATTHWIGKTFLTLYLIGVILLFIRTMAELVQTYRILHRCQRTTLNNTSVCLLSEKQEPYSFFRWICIYPDMHTDKELNEILLHEQTHVREVHSADILLAQLSIIVCWFNPFVWLIRNEIRMNHEYLADKRVVVSGHDKKTYQYHLLGLEHTSLAAANLYNNFSVLPLKNRIKMLNRKRTRNIMKSKYLMFIPVVALLMLFSNCANDQASQTGSTTSEEAQVASEPKSVVAPENLDSTNMVFDIVENMPQFPDGNKALMAFISNNIKYPKDAQDKGIQGRVIAQFVVNVDGTIANAKIIRGVYESLDQEALRVIGEMPKWIPGMNQGKPVRVKYTIPLKFQL